MPYAIINGIRMHFEVSGQGPPVLLINGLSAPAVNWALQAKALARHFQVVVFDNRGVGETDLPPEPVYTTGQMAEDAAALLRHLKIARAHVLGASMGGTIAQELALRYKHLVRSLTLLCTWSEADARFLHTVEAWMSLASRVPIEERYRYVVYPWIFSRPWAWQNEVLLRTRPRRRRSSGRRAASSPGTGRARVGCRGSASRRSSWSARTTS